MDRNLYVLTFVSVLALTNGSHAHEADAIAALEKVGARIVREDKMAGKPVGQSGGRGPG